jgi:hypothetical protein
VNDAEKEKVKEAVIKMWSYISVGDLGLIQQAADDIGDIVGLVRMNKYFGLDAEVPLKAEQEMREVRS